MFYPITVGRSPLPDHRCPITVARSPLAAHPRHAPLVRRRRCNRIAAASDFASEP
jgi:hypothetical protein